MAGRASPPFCDWGALSCPHPLFPRARHCPFLLGGGGLSLQQPAACFLGHVQSCES